MALLLLLCVALFANHFVTGRIINGQDTEKAPFTTMISGYNSDYGTFGGGSFISLTHVLTAGNVIYNMGYWYVDFGNEALPMPYYKTASGVLHPGYAPDTYENDIGILILDSPADSNVVTPIPLPTNPEPPYIYEQGQVSGFGYKQSGSSWILNQRKQIGHFRRIPDDTCNDLLAKNQVTLTPKYMFCAQDEEHGSSICHGDHGSGLTMYIDEVNTLVGVVSVFTNMCHRDYPVVFTKVAPYLDWIRGYVGEGCTSVNC